MKIETDEFLNAYLVDDEYHPLDELIFCTVFHLFEALDNGQDNLDRARGLAEFLKPQAVADYENGKLPMRLSGDLFLVRPSQLFRWMAGSIHCPKIGPGYTRMCEVALELPERKEASQNGREVWTVARAVDYYMEQIPGADPQRAPGRISTAKAEGRIKAPSDGKGVYADSVRSYVAKTRKKTRKRPGRHKPDLRF